MIVGQQITDGEVLWRVAEFFKTEPFDEIAINNKINSLKNDIENMFNVRKNSFTYNKWDETIFSGNSFIHLICLQSGSAGDSDLDLTINDIGTIIEDGETKWLITDGTDGTPVGGIRYSLYVPDGYLAANGAVINRSEYPRLVRLANKNNLWTDNIAADIGKFGVGDGSTTMSLPDLRNKFIEGSETNPGANIAPGLPNITGTISNAYGNFSGGTGSTTVSGSAIRSGNANVTSSSSVYVLAPNTATGYTAVTLNASKSSSLYGGSSTVQPPAIFMIPIIRY